MAKLPKAWQSWRSIPPKDPKYLLKLTEEGLKLTKQRKEYEAQAEAVASELRALKDHMLESFDKASLEKIETKSGIARLSHKDIPQVDKEAGDWPVIFEYIKKNDAFDILQKRLHEGACKERRDAKVQIPGVKWFHKIEVKFGDAE